MGKAPRNAKIAAYRRGFIAEYRAALSLLLSGHRILAMRYKTKAGEIDIVARKKNLVVFVEVKARKSQNDALFAVGGEAQRRIQAASLIWLSKQKDAPQLSRRYDIIAVTPWRWPTHFEDVF